MADLVVSTSAIDITAIMAALTLRARELQREGDPRDLNQLRTDLAVNRLLGNDQTTTATTTDAAATTTTDANATSTATDAAATPDAATNAAATNAADDAAADAKPRAASSAEPAADGEPRWHTADPTTNPDTETAPAENGSSVEAADPFVAGTPGVTADATTTTTLDAGLSADVDAGVNAGVDRGVSAGVDADAGAGRVWGPPESGLNPAVAVQVVIHCTYAEAEALATGAICTGGELEGYGHLPQDALAMAFTRARFRYRLTDRTPKSDPAQYIPSPGLDQHVRDRDQTCRFPGCTARVQSCDLDHRVPFPKGRTDDENLEPLCRHHHRLKHHGDWQVFATDTGTLVFISPTGRAYLEPPTMPDTHPGTPSAESRPDAA
jgi:hypothetical protein